MLPDNYDMWNEHEWKKERWLTKRPICRECGEHIADEYSYQFSGKWYCPDCIDRHKVYIEEE